MARAWGNIKQITRTNRPMLKLRVGGRITGIVRAINIPTFKDEFEEGAVYAFRNYQVESNIGIYRSTIAQYRLILHGRTEHISYKGDFSIFRFDFRRFITLIDIEKIDESMLFDVLGMVVEINPVQMKNVKGVQTRMIAFSLMDPEGNVLPCTLWGTYVDQFLNYENQLAHNGNPWPLIIQLAHLREWDEKVQVTSSKDITRLITGQNIPDIVEFVNRAAAGPLSRARLISKSAIIVKSELQELADGDVVVSAVDSLFATAEETDVWICATVESIIDEWWYHSCRRCTSKM
ncbi:replication protein A 70 kDa DNA-binding subunit, partial [Striga asiatica]